MQGYIRFRILVIYRKLDRRTKQSGYVRMIPSSSLALCVVRLDEWMKIASKDVRHPGDKFVLNFAYILGDEIAGRFAHLGD